MFGQFNFFQVYPAIIGFLLEFSGVHVLPSSYEAGGLPDQGCNRCYNKVFLLTRQSTTPWDLHLLQHSIQAMSTILQHSLPHHDATENAILSAKSQWANSIFNKVIIYPVPAIKVIPGESVKQRVGIG